MRTVFLRLTDAADKVRGLRAPEETPGAQKFLLDPRRFTPLPGAPFAYWASTRVLELFSILPRLEAHGRVATVGASTKADFRYVRAWWEVDPAKIGRSRESTLDREWVAYAKGAQFSQFYCDIHVVLQWHKDGHELKVDIRNYRGSRGWGYHWTAALNGHVFYFCPALTWFRRSHRVGVVALPEGSIFSDGAQAIVADQNELATVGAIANSAPFDALVKLSVGRTGSGVQFMAGTLSGAPYPVDVGRDQKLHQSFVRGWSVRRLLAASVETSNAFVLPALLHVPGDSLDARADAWALRVRGAEAELDEIQAEIDARSFELYGIDEADRGAISEGLAGDAHGFDSEEPAAEVDEVNSEQDRTAAVGSTGLAVGLVSWAVGVAFGRFDVYFATGERELPAEPEPFDPLPVCSPGMLVGEDGLPVAEPPPGYPLDFPTDGILVDDPGDPRDLTAAVRAAFEVVFRANADALWDEAAALLDPRRHDLRAWLRSGFFERHLRLHSKSRRKAPILWQLGTPSGRYSVWLYAHRLTGDSLFQLQNNVMAPKLAYEERQLTNLVQSSGGSPSAKDRRASEAQEAFLEELRVLLEEVKRVAPLWRPTLDDGIVLVMAPLWRLVPHKPWQRELKKKWSELVAGNYDWARLAMHLWPERVVPKCADDRSLAIAHGIEDVFWVEDADGKWQQRGEPTTAVNDLIRERTSPATKDALKTHDNLP